MRVAYVLKRFPRLSQTFVLDEMLELERQGADVVVVAGRGGEEPLVHERVRDLRAPVHVLPPGGGSDDAADLLRGSGAEHVHAHFATWGARTAYEAATQAGLPFSFTAHATDIYRADVDLDGVAERAAAAAFVVTVTDANVAALRHLLAERGQQARVVRLHNGVDLTRLPASSGGRRPDLVVGVGRLVEKKGFDVLLRAAARLAADGRRLDVVVVGEGPERAHLDALSAELGLDGVVTFLGARSQEAVLDLVRSATVFTLPCVVAADGDRDALPTVVLEAMALGTPVVSTRVSGLPEMVTDGESGLLVEQRDPPALADALRQVLDDPARAGAFATAARARVEERFSLQRNVARLRELFAGASA